ncbi:hypothetical protein ACIBF1_20040 [Spirillospora sp. NPDC050679]
MSRSDPSPATRAARDDQGPTRSQGRMTLLAVDIVSFGSRSDGVQLYLRKSLHQALMDALAHAGVPSEECGWEDRGDGFLITASPAIPPALILGPTALEIAAQVRRHNNLSSAAARFRLRMAVHTGIVSSDANGIFGRAVNHVFRLLDSVAFKQTLLNSDAEVALIVSDSLYSDVVAPGMGALDPSAFQPLTVSVKETVARAWAYPLGSEAAGAAPSPPRNGEPEQLRPHLAAALEELGEAGAVGHGGPLTVRVTRDTAEVRVRAEPGPLAAGLPLALVERDGPIHLARLDASGTASFAVRTAEGARLTVPGSVTLPDTAGDAEVEALQIPTAVRFVAADHAAAARTSVRLPGGQIVTVAEKRNRATGRLHHALSVRSDAEADAGSVVLVHAAGELLAVPLTWRAAERRASGELRLGPPSEQLALTVVPEPLPSDAPLDAGLLARSLQRAVDFATREALSRLLERR